MNQKHLKYKIVRCLIDVPLIFLALSIVCAYFPQPEFIYPGKAFISILFIASVVSWYIAAQLSNLYADLRSKKFSEEIIYILFTHFLFVILLSFFLFMIREEIYIGNKFLFVYLTVLLLLVTSTKYMLRKYLHKILYTGRLNENILLIGATQSANDFYDTIKLHFYYGYHCVGFLDNQIKVLNECPYLGAIDGINKVLEEQVIDEVIIALPNSQYEDIRKCMEACDLYGRRVRIIPDLYTYASSNIQINNIGMLPVINLRALPQDRETNKIVKRIFDVLFSISFFLILGWWILPLIALIIKITSKGPAFFKQERWGLNNKMIVCYKFRSMYHNSLEIDEDGKFLQASPNDIRITRVGKFLREWNFDELPQFWNVLIGNMSVVGPRPHVTPLNLSSMHKVDRYMLRHLVKPGITGWAQVNGSRGETKTPYDMQKRVNHDLYYIHNWTFRLDCQIVLQTIITILKGDENAY
ncbi:MAG: undecaprenyl-phosphate glucose phosphotransferase [Sphingobacteriia bacterium]|nr:MAG: undecaprenyl-phosphate glucose phosphotransferase [Sphingobacteriia bacterium]